MRKAAATAAYVAIGVVTFLGGLLVDEIAWRRHRRS